MYEIIFLPILIGLSFLSDKNLVLLYIKKRLLKATAYFLYLFGAERDRERISICPTM